MMYLRMVKGQSMLPTLRPGQICLFIKGRRYEHGDIVFAFAEGRPVVKRVHVTDEGVLLKGDNHQASTDYKVTGKGRKNKIIAKLVWPRPLQLQSENE